jgi:hypothetical protein
VQRVRDRHEIAVTAQHQRCPLCRREVHPPKRAIDGGEVIPAEQSRQETP